jgi:hypothetical protein
MMNWRTERVPLAFRFEAPSVDTCRTLVREVQRTLNLFPGIELLKASGLQMQSV